MYPHGAFRPNPEAAAIQLDRGFSHLAEWTIPKDACTLELFTENVGQWVPEVTAQELGITEESEDHDRANEVRPTAVARVVVKRNWIRYIWSIGYIMAALGISGSSAFLLDPQEDYGDRLATIFTLLLASVAFQTVIDDKLPNIPCKGS